MQRVLSSGEIGVSELLGLLLDLTGGFLAFSVPKAGTHEIIHQRFKEVDAFQLRPESFFLSALVLTL